MKGLVDDIRQGMNGLADDIHQKMKGWLMTLIRK
jgi:hypothetical protein